MADERDAGESDALAILDMIETECAHGWFLPEPVSRVRREVVRLRARVAELEGAVGSPDTMPCHRCGAASEVVARPREGCPGEPIGRCSRCHAWIDRNGDTPPIRPATGGTTWRYADGGD